jgi:hypothetical protein
MTTITNYAYKLVDQDGYTRRGETGERLWLPAGTRVAPTGRGTGPCGPGVLHGYISPEVAVLANPMHAAISSPRLLRISAAKPWLTDGLKRWTTGSCKTVEELPLPQISITELAAWAICLAPHEVTREWAIAWLRGTDRSDTSEGTALMRARGMSLTWPDGAVAATMYAAAYEAAKSAVRAASLATKSVVAYEAERAAATLAAAARAAATLAEATLALSDENAAAFERALNPALDRARKILAGELPAEEYDQEGR